MSTSTSSSLALSATLLATFSVFAEPITIGSLSSDADESTSVIVDSLNKLEWLRWDLTKSLTYAQTLAAIGPGGAYEGFQVAGIAEKTLFLNALLSDSVNLCDETVNFSRQGCGVSGLDGGTELLGLSFNSQFPTALFLSDNEGGADVGMLFTYNTGGFTVSQNDALSIPAADVAYSRGSPGDVSWLLYRSTVQSPGDLISDLADTISGINQIAGLGNSLDAKFNSILRVLNDSHDNNDGAALNGLYALCGFVKAQRGKKLTNAQADDIVAGAGLVITSLSEFAPGCN
jgi:hypothetical protein